MVVPVPILVVVLGTNKEWDTEGIGGTQFVVAAVAICSVESLFSLESTILVVVVVVVRSMVVRVVECK